MFKKLILYCALLLSFSYVAAQDFPAKPSTIVTDFTNTLSADQKQQLENKLVAFNDSTSTQIAVVVMQSTGDYDINEYGALLGRKWGIGQKDKNNGVLLLVAVKDRKLTIQTGYGAEGALPDAITQDIIQHTIKPRFKEGDYYGGINAGTDDIIKYMKGEYKPNPQEAKKASKHKRKNDGGPIGFIVIIVIFILILVIGRRGGGGGGGQIIGRRGSASPFWWFLAGSMLGGSGRSRGSDWGGFSGGGGGWGGGGSSGGGFGGFGGGSFGGGGSSGSW